MHRGFLRTLVVLVTAVALLVGAATGSSAPLKKAPPSPIKGLVKSLKGLSPSAREAKLLDMAKQEGGSLVLYTSLSSLVVKPVVKAFETQYPGIKVDLFRGSSESVTQRVDQEAQAGVPGADIIETNGTEMFFFQAKKNILVPYSAAPNRRFVPARYRFDTYTADRLEEFVVAWNTNKVSSPPKSFQDLADPKWKGQLAMEPSDVDWFAALYTYLTQHGGPHGKKLSPAKVTNIFRGIARNAQIIEGHTTQANLLAAGQFSVIVGGHAQSIEQLQAKKAPIAFKPFVKPVIERPQGLGVAYRLRHPATALLFYDWILSSAGQKVMQDNGVQPARTGFVDQSLSGAFKVRMDLRPIVHHYKAWADKYDAITRLGSGG